MPEPATKQVAPAEPVVVTPKPASKSTTLWFAWIVAAIGGVIALLPELATDPFIIAAMNEEMSPRSRKLVGIALFVIGFIVRNRRQKTSAPIIGTPAAEALPLLKETR